MYVREVLQSLKRLRKQGRKGNCLILIKKFNVYKKELKFLDTNEAADIIYNNWETKRFAENVIKEMKEKAFLTKHVREKNEHN
jgi:hypothetical protein